MPDLDSIRAELAAASADAGVDPRSIAVFVVEGTRPAGTTPMAYLHPEGNVWPDTVAVFRAVGPERANGRAGAHRLALWAELPGIPRAALGPMFRHELEHARRWERSGTRFYDADDLLRSAIRNAGGDGYGELPTELEANAASAAYAARTLTPDELADLRACADCAGLLEPRPPLSEVAEATLEELARREDWAPWLDARGRHAYIEEVRAACAAWDAAAPLRHSLDGAPELLLVAPERWDR